jgi:hypothetical protein
MKKLSNIVMLSQVTFAAQWFISSVTFEAMLQNIVTLSVAPAVKFLIEVRTFTGAKSKGQRPGFYGFSKYRPDDVMSSVLRLRARTVCATSECQVRALRSG